MFTVKILMQAAVVVFPVTQKQWGRTLLAGVMTDLAELVMTGWKSFFNPHGGMPAISDRRQMGVQRLAQPTDQIGQRIAEILVFASSEGVALHDNATTELLILWK